MNWIDRISVFASDIDQKMEQQSRQTVHGLAGNPYWSWIGNTAETPHVHVDWLKELLPELVPSCRILSFGYDSRYMRNAPKRDISNCAEELLHALSSDRSDAGANGRPIVFICHSLGGIVVKEALVKATLATRLFGDIRNSTHAIIFLGTPHNGSSGAKYGEILANVAKALGRGSDTRLVRSLRENSPELMKLAGSFSDIYEDFDIFCFYELYPMAMSRVIVTQASATIPGRPSDGLYADHSTISKFADSSDPNFVKFAKVLKNMLGSLIRGADGTATYRERQPWEVTAKLTSELSQRLDDRIQLLQTLSGIDHDQEAQSLVLLRYRLQSWAFQLGLLALSETRQPLHPSLDGPRAKMLNQHLQNMLEALGASGEPHRGRFLEALRTAFSRISGLLSANHGLPASYLTASLALEPASSLGSQVTSAVESDPDIRALVAMKRISILMGQSTVTNRTTDDPIAIDLRAELSLDRSSSTTLSTGVFRGRANVEGGDCLVEWKYYDQIWGTDAGNVLFSRVELLTEFLRTASSSSNADGDIDLRMLECLGYCHDEDMRKLGLVFALPRGLTDRQRSVVRLDQLMTAYQTQERTPPSVGHRVRLARMLCEAVFGLHVGGWFHKGLCARNVIFVADGGDADHGDDNENDGLPHVLVENFSILSPYLIGFEHSRQGEPAAFSEPGAATGPMRRFTHPAYGDHASPLQKYRHEFDYYSLGLVLIEIGYWTPLELLLEGQGELLGTQDEHNTKLTLAQHLNGLVGDVFEATVLELLGMTWNGNPGIGSVVDNEFMETAALLSFQTSILEGLGSVRI